MEPPQSTNSLGRLWFSVYYDYVESTLVLRILHARYTKGRGSSTNPGDVWVEACVLTPMNMVKGSTKTGTRRASSAPVFNQTFRFKVGDEEVTQYLLRLTLYDRHPQNGEKAVGSVIVPLSTVDLCSSATISRDLQ
nr:synaptotagmin-1-like [Procambarus clarkii]